MKLIYKTDSEGDPTHVLCTKCGDGWIYVNAENCPMCGVDIKEVWEDEE